MRFSEDTLNMAAQDIVDKFMSTGETLTHLVKTKVANFGWNNNQASRLVERVNGEAFIKMFPDTTNFAVAEPEDVTGIKVASEKVASEEPQSSKSYRKAIERDFSEILGVENEKFASSVDAVPQYSKLAFLDTIWAERFGEAAAVELTAKNLEKEARENALFHAVRDTVRWGTPFNEIEVKLHEVYPTETLKVAAYVDALHEKLAADTALDVRLLKRAHVEEIRPHRVNTEDDITRAFKMVL